MKIITSMLALCLLFVATASSAEELKYEWAKKLAGNAGYVTHTAIARSSKDVYTAGRFDATTDFDPGPGVTEIAPYGTGTLAEPMSDMYLAKHAADGTFVWVRRIGGLGYEFPMGLAVDGNSIYVGGYFDATTDFDPGPGQLNMTPGGQLANSFISKYDSSGNMLWTRGLLGTGQAMLSGLGVDGSGNVIVSGTFTGTIDFDPSAAKNEKTSTNKVSLFIAKYSAAGNLMWVDVIDSTGNLWFPSLAVDANGRAVVSVEFSGTVDADPMAWGQYVIYGGTSLNTPTALLIAQYNPNGSLRWARGVPGAGIMQTINESVGNAITTDVNGNVLVTGQFTGTVNFGAGWLTAFGDSDAFVAKYSADNVPQWAIQLGGTGYETGTAIATDIFGSVYVSGEYWANGNYNPAAGATAPLSFAGGTPDGFVAKFTSKGTYVSAFPLHSSNMDVVQNITVDFSNNVYVSGHTAGTVDFDPSTSVAPLSGGSFVAKYSQALFAIRCYPIGGVTGCEVISPYPWYAPLQFVWSASNSGMQVYYPQPGYFPYTTGNDTIYFDVPNSAGPATACPSGTQMTMSAWYQGLLLTTLTTPCP